MWSFAAVVRGPVGLVLVVLAGLGPAASAAILVRRSRSGRSLRAWFRGLLRWRVQGRYYAYALGLPVALYAVVDLVLVLTGETLDWSLLVERAPCTSPRWSPPASCSAASSVLLCLLLHAGLTAAQDHLVLTTDSLTVDVTILLTYVAGAALLVVLTRGRLGFRPTGEPA